MSGQTYVQLDIFNFVEEQQKDDLKSLPKGDPAQLTVGDIVEFISYGGKLLTGRFVTKGFWDGRDKECPEYYYFDVDGKFYQIMPTFCAWRVLGHDVSYKKPDTAAILPRLIDHLKALPFSARLEAYKAFQNTYPYTSCEYSSHISDAWKQAIVAVTTMKEVLANLKHWSNREKFPKDVKEYLAKTVLPLAPERRLEAMFCCQWEKTEHYEATRESIYARKFNPKTYSFYEPLFRHLIAQAGTAEELISVASLWSVDFRLKETVQRKAS